MFSQYECPIISIYDPGQQNDATTYHTFFGGISHHYYWQTSDQKEAYEEVTAQGRNDGLPYVADITTMSQDDINTYKQFIHTSPIPGNKLLGTSIQFIVDPTLITNEIAFENGVINLSKIETGSSLVIGYIYGGILAEEPLPLKPNSGTYATNTFFQVQLKKTPSDGIPASEAKEAVKNFDIK